MKLRRKENAPSLKTKEGAILPSPVYESIQTLIVHGLGLQIVIGLYSTPTAKSEGKSPISTKTFNFNTKQAAAVYVSENGTDVVFNAQTGEYIDIGDAHSGSVDVSDLELKTPPKGTYQETLAQMDIQPDKVLLTTDNAKNWLLNQRDTEGHPMSLYWEFDE
jgi:hypothetical protein